MRDVPAGTVFDGLFRIDEERLSDTIVLLALHGEADLHSAPELRARLRVAIEDGARNVILDLSDSAFVDSTSLGVLLGGMRRLREHDGQIHLVVPRPDIRRIFEITLLDRIFPLYDSRQDALAAASVGG
jgi:anti-sigma B factor antagonist